jgi:fluoride exporter
MSWWIGVLLFAVLAAIATIVRGELSRLANRLDRLPWGTFVVNVTGSVALGAFVGAGPEGWLFVAVAVGGLGAFTTMSTVARELASLGGAGRWSLASWYLVLTLVCGVGGAWFGLVLTS